MRKQQAEVIRIESEQAGWKPILAKVKEGDKWTWQIWGIEPNTQKKTFIVSREQWEQFKQYAEYCTTVTSQGDAPETFENWRNGASTELNPYVTHFRA